jgi:DNA topoisomerase-1
VKDGRWGPYVTDGDTNASLRKSDTIENVTIERAAELLQIRREWHAGCPVTTSQRARNRSTGETACSR